MVEVFDIPAAKWAKIAERAEPLSVFKASRHVAADGTSQDVLAITSSKGDRYYCVVVTIDGAGVHAECDCPAGGRDTACKHVAKALQHTGNWDLAVPQRKAPRVVTRSYVRRDGVRVTEVVAPWHTADDDPAAW